MGRFILFAVLLTLLLPFEAAAEPVGTAGEYASPGDLIPLGVRSFGSAEVLKMDLARKVRTAPSLRIDGMRDASVVALAESTPARRGRGYVPVLLSLLVPGAGEIYMGYYKRGAALVGMEAAAWIGYSVYRARGLDTRTEYEHYADDHWSISRWLSLHPSGPYATLEDLEADGASGAWQSHLRGSVSTDFFYMPFISRVQDKQHYYENIGKYNWFVSGWDDWDSSLQDDNSFTETTANRRTYFSMRVESNNQLEDADRFTYLSIAARAFSLIETIMLIRGDEETPLQGPSGNTRLFVTGEGWHAARVAMEYDFR